MDETDGGQGKRVPRQYGWVAELDSILEQGYRKGGCGRHQAINQICQLTGWPRQACWDRARKLGLAQKRSEATRRWTQVEEQQLLTNAGCKNAHLIAGKLNRTVLAVRAKLRRMQECSLRVREGHTRSELAQYLGRSLKTIQRWIDLGWLKGNYEGKQREDDTFRISDADFRTFWKTHPTEVPFHTLSRDGLEWFLSLMVDVPKMRTFSRPRTRKEATNTSRKQLASSMVRSS